MKTLRVLRVLALIGAGGFLAAGYLTGGRPSPAAAAVLIAVLSLFFDRSRWKWGPSLSFLGFGFLSGGGMIAGVGSGWMVAGLVFDLAAWDLAGFSAQLVQFGNVEDLPGLVRRHLALLAAVGLVSLAAALLVPAAAVEIRFFWIVIMAAGLILILNRLVNQLKDD